jgi:hypothetical protein
MKSYAIIFYNDDGTTTNAILVADVTLPTNFWTIVPAANGIEYSGYPAGNPPQPVWTAIPNYLAQTTALSVNIKTTYLTPTVGATVVVNGSLPSGWTFDGTTLAYDGTTVGGPNTITFTATYSGLSATSNSVQLQGVGVPSTDTIAPTVPVGTSLQSPATSSQVVIGGITPSDPNQPNHTWSGLAQINVTRTPPGSVIGHTTIGPGNQPILQTADIGPQSSTITISAPDVTFTTTATDNPYPTVDGRAFAYQQINATSWTVSCKIASFTGNANSTLRLEARTGLGATAAFVAAYTFPFGGGIGVGSTARAATGGNAGGINSAGNSTSPIWLVINRNADVYTFYYSTDGNALISLGATTQVMGATLYVGAAAVANGASITATINQISIQTLGNWTYTDSTVSAGTAYTYAAASQDLTGTPNISANSAAVSISTPSTSPSITFHPGMGFEDSQNVRGYGSSWTVHSPFSQLEYFCAHPNPYLNNVVTYVVELNWGCFEQTKGVYDFSVIDYAYNLLAQAGRYLVIYQRYEAVPFLSIATAFSQQYYPAYINDAAGANVYGGALPIYFGLTFGGSVACFTRPAVRTAFGNMITAMANHVVPASGVALKDSPWFEGIVFVETSYNLASGPYDGYASQAAWDTAYITQYIENLKNARAAFPHKLVTCRANWGTNANMQLLAANLLTYQCGSGPTDCYTQGKTNLENVLDGTVGGIDYRPQIPITPFSETSGLGPNATAAQIVNWVKTVEKAHYFWPSRYSGPPVNVPDGWVNSTWAQIQQAFVDSGGLAAWNTTKPTSYP